MVAWFIQRFCAFGVFGLLVNLLVLDFQPQKGVKGKELWEVKTPVVFQEADSTRRSRELFFASPKLSESEFESAGSMRDLTESN